MPLAELPSANLYYEVQGDLAHPTIVMIRGLGTQMIEWPEALLEGLVSNGWSIVIFDNRDVGLSQKMQADYELQDMATDVVHLLDYLHIDQAHIFGISLGGMVAQLIAYAYPERSHSLISVMSGSGNPQVPTVSAEMLPALVESAEGREANIELTTRNKVLFGSPGYPESESYRRSQATLAYDRCYYPEGVARQMRAATRDGSRVERLQQISVPTMIIHGAEDALVSRAAGEETAKHIKGAQLHIIEGMGHNIPVALVPKFIELLKKFIQ